MKSLRLPARAVVLAIIVSLAAGGVVGAAAERFSLRHSPSYEYLVFPAAGTLQPGQVVWLEATGRVAHATDDIFAARQVIGVVVRERAPRGSVAVAVQGVVDVNREEIYSQTHGGAPQEVGGDVQSQTGSSIGVALRAPATGPITVLLHVLA